MQHTLTMYSNQQSNPIKIADYTLLEFYKDSISSDNRLGYNILPIENMPLDTIKTKIAELAKEACPDGYSKYAVLADRTGAQTYESFNHRICFIVFYTGSVIPTYPAEPAIKETGTPAEPFNAWNQVSVENQGNPTYVTLSLTIDSTNNLPLVFYVNEDKFSVSVASPGELKIGQQGVYLNNTKLSDFELTNWPYLKMGNNSIRVPKKNVAHLKVSYAEQY